MSHKPEHLVKGKAAEDQALAYLTRQGLKLVERNFNTPSGEIDLIMQDRDSVVFVEVRFRKNSRFGHPAETISAAKIQRLIKTSQRWITQHHYQGPYRFDVVAITSDNTSSPIQWISDAIQHY